MKTSIVSNECQTIDYKQKNEVKAKPVQKYPHKSHPFEIFYANWKTMKKLIIIALAVILMACEKEEKETFLIVNCKDRFEGVINGEEYIFEPSMDCENKLPFNEELIQIQSKTRIYIVFFIDFEGNVKAMTHGFIEKDTCYIYEVDKINGIMKPYSK